MAITVRPAEAEAEAQIRRADGDRQARIAQAQADAERVRLAGEAQARVVEVTAEATAKQTTLEGNAEAGIVLSKGEAEARALALRAEAYRQFNEAAVIQTVLSMLPEIVRAAAEPMANIGSLTVLSSDGASDVVKTTTRTVAEAGAAVKGLTGIDVPAMLASAMGTAVHANGGPAPTPAGGGGATGGTGGSGEGPRATPTPPATGPASATARRATASPPIDGPSRPPVDPGAAFEQAGRAIDRASWTVRESAAAVPPPPDAPALPGLAATEPPGGAAPSGRVVPADHALEPPRPSARVTSASGRARTGRPASLDMGRETTLDEAATRLAADLQSVPGIERFGGVRLGELDRTGPRPLRTMWRIAREELDDRWADVTIGEMLDRYGSGRSGGTGASA